MASQSSLNHAAPQEPRFLVLFDFDETIISENSDDSAVCLLPSRELPSWLISSYREGHYHEFSAKIMAYLADQGVTKESLQSGVERIPANPGILDLFRYLQSHQKDFELVVVSDANTFFIETWLESHGVRHLFRRIFTNPSHFDAKGCLVLRPFHSHSCQRCPENMCKQAILREYLAEREKERGGVGFQRVFYVGDGSNDVCPTQALGTQDTALARRNYPMHRLLVEMQQLQSANLKANVVPWVTGDDIVDFLEKIMER